jgi:hypothetical protein
MMLLGDLPELAANSRSCALESEIYVTPIALTYSPFPLATRKIPLRLSIRKAVAKAAIKTHLLGSSSLDILKYISQSRPISSSCPPFPFLALPIHGGPILAVAEDPRSYSVAQPPLLSQ